MEHVFALRDVARLSTGRESDGRGGPNEKGKLTKHRGV